MGKKEQRNITSLTTSFNYTQILLVACLTVLNLVKVESRHTQVLLVVCLTVFNLVRVESSFATELYTFTMLSFLMNDNFISNINSIINLFS